MARREAVWQQAQRLLGPFRGCQEQVEGQKITEAGRISCLESLWEADYVAPEALQGFRRRRQARQAIAREALGSLRLGAGA